MKILLDECIARKFKNSLTKQDCQTVPEAGLAGKKNGVLLSLAEGAGFDLFLTVDKGVQYQQNLTGRNIAVIIIPARSNRLADLLLYAEACLAAIDSIESGRTMRLAE
jgi:hypothetical protein